jgi:Cytochrome P450
VTHVDSVESAGGRLGAVLSAPRVGVVSLGSAGPWLVTTPPLARQVLTDLTAFDFPGHISRGSDLSASRGDTRSGHLTFAPLTPVQVAHGVATFTREWAIAIADHDRDHACEPYDAMVLLRRPVALSTTAAVLTEAPEEQRSVVAGLVLDWIDALAPVIAARRPPRRWSRARRAERHARHALEDALDGVPGLVGTAAQAATMLAAGIQVPIAAGAWLLAWIADHPGTTVDPVHAVWETLRLTPPTWITARITTGEVDLGGEHLPPGAVVLVSPLLLGRLDDLVPGDAAGLSEFDPDRWDDSIRRPGAWLPFGAGPHACPGRTLGMAVLVELAQWAIGREISLSEDVAVDQSRGIAPQPCRFTVTPTGEQVT